MRKSITRIRDISMYAATVRSSWTNLPFSLQSVPWTKAT